MVVEKVRKRDGSVVSFKKDKIAKAIFKAAEALGGKDRKLANEIAEEVSRLLEEENHEIPGVEHVQDMVEKVLIEKGHARTAKAYILYRQKRGEIREEKKKILEKGEIDEVDKIFDVNALRVLKSRYLRKDDNGHLMESPKQLFTRVAVHAALPDLLYDERVYDIDSGQEEHEEPGSITEEGKIKIGKYVLNQYHLKALKKMYHRADKKGQIRVSWSRLIEMLTNGDFYKYEKIIEDFYSIMAKRKFMPNTPAIANFGAPLGMGTACYVLDIEDSLESIMGTLKCTATIHQSGGGTGFNFSKLRPEGDVVKSSCGIASGPISFMTLYDNMTDVIKQGGIRRGANIGILNSNHPDIEKFITAKEGNKALRNFNISVLIMEDFWKHYKAGTPYPLVNPRSSKVVRHVDPKMLFDRIVYQAWESAEPGVIFFDRVNEYNPFLEHLGPIVTTNPCGEVLLYPNEPCNLGSVNVWAFVKHTEKGTEVDWDDMARVIRLATKFLDNVIDVNRWPLDQIEEMALNTRKIGLGIMGLADMLYDIKLPYNSDEGRGFMEKLAEFVNYWSKVQSIDLAKTRGPLPYYNKSFYPQGKMPFAGFYDKEKWSFQWEELAEKIKKNGIRNGYTTVIAPTGSISMIAGCSSGMEPVYTLVFQRNIAIGSFYCVDPALEKQMEKLGILDEALMKNISENGGRLQNIPYIPDDVKRVFVTAMDITPEDHIRALAAFQKWVDSSISKTNNFPADATVEDVRKSYLLAYELGCKDVTVYRDMSIKDQALVAPKAENPEEQITAAPVTAMGPAPEAGVSKAAIAVTTTQQQYAQAIKGEIKTCPECESELMNKEGCISCIECGWGRCSL